MEIDGLRELLQGLDELPRQVVDAANRGIYRATVKVWKESVLNAPRSPSLSQESRATRKTRADTSNRKRATATTRAKPGGLERSISMEVDTAGMSGAVFCAANSEAGKYAARIHDEKGGSWQNRGPGTIAKGSRADDKFVERALTDNEGNVKKVIEQELGRVNL